MNKQEIVAGTLAWCNERRAEKGLAKLDDLPKGFRIDGRSCPCGAATGLFVGTYHYWAARDTGEPIGRVPVVVGAFIESFDDGEFPEYEHE